MLFRPKYSKLSYCRLQNINNEAPVATPSHNSIVLILSFTMEIIQRIDLIIVFTIYILISSSASLVQSLFVSKHRMAGGGTHSRFFLDSANEKEWEVLLDTGVFHGVTTNPFVLKEMNQPCTIENLHRMAHVALKSVNEFVCQTWGTTAEEMYNNGMRLTQPARDRIVVKVPITFTGIQVANKLIRSGCRVCLTAVLDHKQALLAVALGAEYMAPCLGIMNDIGKDGMQECMNMLEIVQGLKGQTRVMIACIRDVDELSQLACGGMDTTSFSPDIARKLFAIEPMMTDADVAAAEYEQITTETTTSGANETTTSGATTETTTTTASLATKVSTTITTAQNALETSALQETNNNNKNNKLSQRSIRTINARLKTARGK